MDFVAASFVRKPEDILEIRQILLAEGSHMHIIAKIEDREGVENIDEIIRVADGIMVARGRPGRAAGHGGDARSCRRGSSSSATTRTRP